VASAATPSSRRSTKADGVLLAKKAARHAPKHRRITSPAIRYMFYAAFLLAIILTALLVYLYQANYLTLSIASAGSSIFLSLIFPFAAFAYLIWRGNSPKSMIAQLGLKKKGVTVRNVFLGIALFLAVLLTELLLAIFQELTHISLPTNVQTVFAGLPLYFLVFAAFVAPFNEEIFFRGLLVPRLSIALSALFFALLHYLSYQASISEFIAAFMFGLLAGYAFKRTKSLYPSIIAHTLVNSLAVMALIWSGMLTL